jgi:acetyl esterase/lipase
VSRLFGDLTGLPPPFVTATRGEVLLGDATRLAERAEKSGVDETLRLARIPSVSTRSFRSSRNREHDGRRRSLGAV